MAIESPTNSANQISRVPTVSDIDLTNDFGQFGLSSYTPNRAKGSIDLWHRRLGHVNQEVLSHLADHSSNITIDSTVTAKSANICEICKVSKAK
jgi:hypothetical protein